MTKRSKELFCAEVVRRDELTPSMIRLGLGGEAMAEWTSDDQTDAYFVIWLPRPNTPVSAPFELEQVKQDLPEDQWPCHRHYTVRRWDEEAHELTVDFVVHGDAGIAGPWARKAQVGDKVMLTTARGGYRPDTSADWHLLVGDESAFPAMGAALEALPAHATAIVVAVCDGPEHQLDFASPATVTTHWLHRTGAPADADLLVDAVRALDWPPGRVQPFVHGEAGEVRAVRRHLLGDRKVTKDGLSLSGYWRRTLGDEAWRSIKRSWNIEVENDVLG